ncbi:MAG: ABC transporter ATP-binding protein [Endozoicomonas sp.]
MTDTINTSLAVDIKDLVLKIQDHTCLEVPSLQIQKGEAVLIRGENGSGKTTLLRVLSGLLEPDSGEVAVLGTDIKSLPPARKDQFRADHIGYIFQRFNLLPYMPAIDNILLPCGFSKRRKEQVTRQGTTPQFEAYQLMAQLKLEDPGRLRTLTGKLSIGLQQRVAIARALIGSPDLILADEPAASLDQASRKTVYDLLISVCRANQSTLICISHDNNCNDAFDRTLSMADINRAMENNPLW